MDSPSPPPRLQPLPSIHLHPSLSSAARHPQTSTRAPTAPPTRPSPRTEGRRFGEFELSNTSRPSHSHSTYRTTSRPSTASSIDENSDVDVGDEWDHPHPPNRHRHHPYQSHSSSARRPPLSASPSYSRRESIYSAYSQSHDDMRAFLRGSASASANASADEGSNSNSYYDGDSPVASLSTTSSPIFTFVPGGHAVNSHQSHHTSHGHGINDGSSSAGRPGAGLGAGSGGGAGGGGGGSGSGGNQNTAAPLSLDSLPSYPPDQKPPFSYPVLIRLAILGSPQKRLLLSQIYSAIEDKFPWYRDSAPKAWKASVRHCLSLNKEFVRMQRAVEDPGVGCGGWWSVGEGMKGLKRPRKRRPAQSRRPEHELDPTPIIKTPTPSPLAIRRRHSTTFEDALPADPYSRYISPLSSASLPPSAVDGHLQRGEGMKERRGELLPPMEDFSLRLPPLHIPNATHPLATPPSSSRTVIFGSSGGEIGGEIKREFSQGGNSFNSSYAKPRGTHTPTASSSSSYSTQSYGSASSASSSSRPNPMSISSLLNERDATVAVAVTERLDKMDIDMDMDVEEPSHSSHHSHYSPSPAPPTLSSLAQAAASASASALVQPKREPEPERDVEMLPALSGRPAQSHSNRNSTKVETPFSSDQTLRPPSPSSTSPQSHGRRSTTPVATAPTPKPVPSTPGPSSKRSHSPNPLPAPTTAQGTVPTTTEQRHTPAPSAAEGRHRTGGDRHRDRERERERERERVPHGEARPSSRSRTHAERTAPAKPSRPPPPVPGSSSSAAKGSVSTRERERERKSTKSGGSRSSKSTTAKSAGTSKPWASSMDLSRMEPESESE